MPNTITSRFYNRLVTSIRRGTRSLSAYHQVRRWRREVLRALRQRSRE